jgi:hypothetical protein
MQMRILFLPIKMLVSGHEVCNLVECKNAGIFVSTDGFTLTVRTSFKLFTVSCNFSVTWLMDCYSVIWLIVHLFTCSSRDCFIL